MEEERHKLDRRTLIDLFFDSVHLTMLHYGLWFRETEHQIGFDKAIMADEMVWKQVLSASMKGIAQRFKIPVKDGTFGLLANLSQEDLAGLLEDMGKNWLVIIGDNLGTFPGNSYSYCSPNSLP